MATQQRTGLLMFAGIDIVTRLGFGRRKSLFSLVVPRNKQCLVIFPCRQQSHLVLHLFVFSFLFGGKCLKQREPSTFIVPTHKTSVNHFIQLNVLCDH